MSVKLKIKSQKRSEIICLKNNFRDYLPEMLRHPLFEKNKDNLPEMLRNTFHELQEMIIGKDQSLLSEIIRR